ncbi:hypothetical protein OJAV_G00035410 [Oryzias javanicus]|uniref:DUF4685 domain-containing protein n=1 Tax=Oryzias javanicus TaxID=123683 RepID=A0A437DFS3_ORYJA|nr:hypothetical protein OJAV_G00035410 [Oryzias javanicus]
MINKLVDLGTAHLFMRMQEKNSSGVRSQQQAQLDEVMLSEHLGNLNSFGSVAESARQHLVVSANRLLRFEDETEKEVETRYLERWSQRRQEMQRRAGVLVSKPDLESLKAGLELRQGKSPAVGRLRGQTVMRELGKINPGVRVSGGGVILDLSLNEDPPMIEERQKSLNRKQLRLRTEPLRETYIGCVTPSDTGRQGEKTCRESCAQVRQRTTHSEMFGSPQTASQPLLLIDPPTGSESSCSDAPHVHVSCSPSFRRPLSLSSPSKTSVMPQRNASNSRKQGKDLNQNQDRQRTPSCQRVHRHLGTGPELMEKVPFLEKKSREPNPAARPSSSGTSLEMKAGNQTPPALAIRDGSSTKSLRSEFPTEEDSHSERRQSRSRTRSLDRLPSKTQPPVSGPTHLGDLRSCGFLKTPPSVRWFCEGSNIFPMTKFSSVFNVWSEQNCSTDGRSADDH